MIRPLLFISFICWSIPLSAQESTRSAGTPLTLEEAVNIAQATNRQVKNAILTAAIDDDQVAEARTYRWPSFWTAKADFEKSLGEE
jgi:hypothetical protein